MRSLPRVQVSIGPVHLFQQWRRRRRPFSLLLSLMVILGQTLGRHQSPSSVHGHQPRIVGRRCGRRLVPDRSRRVRISDDIHGSSSRNGRSYRRLCGCWRRYGVGSIAVRLGLARSSAANASPWPLPLTTSQVPGPVLPR